MLTAARPERLPGADAHLIFKRELVTVRHKNESRAKNTFMTPHWFSHLIISGRDTLGGESGPPCCAVAGGMGRGAFPFPVGLDRSNDSLAETFSLCQSSAWTRGCGRWSLLLHSNDGEWKRFCADGGPLTAPQRPACRASVWPVGASCLFFFASLFFDASVFLGPISSS